MLLVIICRMHFYGGSERLIGMITTLVMKVLQSCVVVLRVICGYAFLVVCGGIELEGVSTKLLRLSVV